MPRKRTKPRRTSNRKARNAVTSRSYRLSDFVAAALATHAKATGLSTNHLLDMAATAAFRSLKGEPHAARDFAKLLDAAAAAAAAEKRAQRLTAEPRRAFREARARLKAATAAAAAPTPAGKEPRQSA